MDDFRVNVFAHVLNTPERRAQRNTEFISRFVVTGNGIEEAWLIRWYGNLSEMQKWFYDNAGHVWDYELEFSWGTEQAQAIVYAKDLAMLFKLTFGEHFKLYEVPLVWD